MSRVVIATCMTTSLPPVRDELGAASAFTEDHTPVFNAWVAGVRPNSSVAARLTPMAKSATLQSKTETSAMGIGTGR